LPGSRRNSTQPSSSSSSRKGGLQRYAACARLPVLVLLLVKYGRSVGHVLLS
jgi:hypothetical protein